MEFFLAQLHNRALRQERGFRYSLDPLSLSDEDLIRKFRFPHQELLGMVPSCFIRRRTRRVHAILEHTKFLVALRIYASRSFQYVVGDPSYKCLLSLTTTIISDCIVAMSLSCQVRCFCSDVTPCLLSSFPIMRVFLFTIAFIKDKNFHLEKVVSFRLGRTGSGHVCLYIQLIPRLTCDWLSVIWLKRLLWFAGKSLNVIMTLWWLQPLIFMQILCKFPVVFFLDTAASWLSTV